MRVLRRVVVVIAVIVCTPIVLGIIGTLVPHPFSFSEPSGTPLTHRILLVANPIHTDIAIPIEPESLAAFSFLAETGMPIEHPQAKWMLIGWGARGFYLETPTLGDMKPWPTFRALTVDSSVMHVDVFSEISQTDPVVTPLDVSSAAYTQMLGEISRSFTRRDGKVLPIEGYALGVGDQFYEGEGLFNALLGCNVWTSRILRSAGIRTGLWNPLPVSLTFSLKLFNGLPAPEGAGAVAP